MIAFMVALAIKAAVIFAVTIVSARLLRRRSAAVQHMVWATGMIACALLPICAVIVPEWQSAAAARATDVVIRSAQIAIESTPPADGATMQTTAIMVDPEMNVADIVLGLWVAGFAIGVIVLTIGLARLCWIAAQARPISNGRWQRAEQDVSNRLGIKRPVQVLQHPAASMLATWGFSQPRVLLPAEADEWSDERMYVVLCHEMAHIRRHDWLVQILAELVRAVYWFNPLSWIVCHRLRSLSERASDDVVLNLGVDANDYATHLLQLARALKDYGRNSSPALAMAGESNLERRFLAMLNPQLNRSGLTRKVILVTSITTLCFVLPLAAMQPIAVGAAVEANQPETSPQSTTGTIQGTVFDASGAVVPGVHLSLSGQFVTATAQRQGEIRLSKIVDSTGSFEFSNLPPGQYMLSGELPGFQPFHSETFSLEPNLVVRQDVPLTLGGIQTRVMVNPATPEQRLRASLPATPDQEREIERRKALEAEVATGQIATRGQRDIQAPGGPKGVSINPLQAGAVGGNVQHASLLSRVEPVYPQSALNAGVEGRIVLEGIIRKDGTITVTRVISGDINPPNQDRQTGLDFAQAATEAVSQWIYRPTLLNGVPVAVTTTIEVDFRLNGARGSRD